MVSHDRYPRTIALLHWTIAALVLANAGLALFRESFAAYAVDMISAHKMVGLAILFLSLGMLAARIVHRPPPLPPEIRPWEARLARGVHRLLYLFMIAVPAAGWIFVSYAPDTRPLDYRGLNSVPELPTGQNDGLSFFWHEVHELMGFAMIGLFLLHSAAALKHQFLDKTNILARMLPG